MHMYSQDTNPVLNSRGKKGLEGGGSMDWFVVIK